MELGKLGIWSGEFRSKQAGDAGDAAAEIEDLGFGALWIPGGAGGNVFGAVTRTLDATRALPVATGILNVWMHDATEVAAEHARISAAYPDRFLLGLGVSHAPLVESTNRKYVRPYSLMVHYLDELDSAQTPVRKEDRVLAALGPKMLELARDRSAGAHPYLTTPEHTRWARSILGAAPLLAPEQMVVLESDPTTARAVARESLAIYLQLPNYTNNMLRFGFTEADLVDGGSDRLIDGHVAWGGVGAVAGRIRQHLDAGADHVCIQVLRGSRDRYPLAEWRELAAILPELQT
jgi:probable F420-dependent oxidoreductase